MIDKVQEYFHGDVFFSSDDGLSAWGLCLKEYTGMSRQFKLNVDLKTIVIRG